MLLCRTFGCTLDELGARMSSAEFDLWIQDYEREPWGELRADIRSAHEQANVANWAGKELKKDVSVKPLDFMLDFDREKQPQTTEIPPEQVFGGMN
jgi:hypothetical protein